MPEYLLPLSVLHAAAPGVLDVVFGKDGAGDNRPNFTGPVYGSAGGYAPGQMVPSNPTCPKCQDIQRDYPRLLWTEEQWANFNRAFVATFRGGQ